MKNYSNIVVLTGAGISAESGIRTFRAADGLWEDHRIEDVATPEAFSRDPNLVQRFYNMRRAQLLEMQNGKRKIQPKREFSGQVLVVTQNIDNLHETAGSKTVLHMHGEILKMHCKKTQEKFVCERDLSINDLCECCEETGNLRPHIVWFGETPLFMEEIYQALEQCELFVAIGTSGNVYPAAGFVEFANQVGADTLEINIEESSVASAFDQTIYQPATEAVPIWAEALIKHG
ncbi:UNVERIFIED_CONTAM: hypothetical protein GTU68_057005 [Idotea baltica]|nr:hypothetical protein [Idotea baltica]